MQAILARDLIKARTFVQSHLTNTANAVAGFWKLKAGVWGWQPTLLI